MTSPVIPLRELHRFMMAHGLHYSLGVLLLLNFTAIEVQHAKQAKTPEERDALLNDAAQIQSMAIGYARYEARSGLIFEKLLPRLSAKDVTYLYSVHEEWRQYLAVLGYTLPPMDMKNVK